MPTMPEAPRSSDGRWIEQFDADAIMPAILHRIACGESVHAICREPSMPSTAWVFLQCRQGQWAPYYERVRELQADHFADMIGQLATDVLAGEVKPDEARVAGQLMLWRARVQDRRRYGDAGENAAGLGVPSRAKISELLARARARTIASVEKNRR